MTTKVNKLVLPGRIVSRIVIQADDKGVIRVEALDFGPLAKAGAIQPSLAATPMDTRTMILALHKVIMDYTAVMFRGLAPQPVSTPEDSDGETSNDSKDHTH